MAAKPNAVERAVSRTLRDNLGRIQRATEELDQAINDLVSACASNNPANVLPPIVRAQTSAASLSAALEVLSRLVTGALQPPLHLPLEKENPSDAPDLPTVIEQPEPPPAHPTEEKPWTAPEPSDFPPPDFSQVETPPVAESRLAEQVIAEEPPVQETSVETMPSAMALPTVEEVASADASPATAEPSVEETPPVDAMLTPEVSAVEEISSVDAMLTSEVPPVEETPPTDATSAIEEPSAIETPPPDAMPTSEVPAVEEVSSADATPATAEASVGEMPVDAHVAETVPSEAVSVFVYQVTREAEPPVADEQQSEGAPPQGESAFNLDSLSPEEQELHRRAYRVAKVSMQDIKMLRPQDVRLGRENKDLCFRLRDDIEKAHKEYDRRFQAICSHPVDYFYNWMVEILAGGDPEALGEYPYPSPVLRR